MTHRVLGIDPGLAETGWGLVDSDGMRHRHVDHGGIITNSDTPIEMRLLNLHREFKALIDVFKPSAMAVESLFFTKNISSAIPVAQARGIALLVAAQSGMTLAEYSPMTIKQSVVGSGTASKQQMQHMVSILLGLDYTVIENDHAADALAAAITLIHHGALWSTASPVS